MPLDSASCRSRTDALAEVVELGSEAEQLVLLFRELRGGNAELRLDRGASCGSADGRRRPSA